MRSYFFLFFTISALERKSLIINYQSNYFKKKLLEESLRITNYSFSIFNKLYYINFIFAANNKSITNYGVNYILEKKLNEDGEIIVEKDKTIMVFNSYNEYIYYSNLLSLLEYEWEFLNNTIKELEIISNTTNVYDNLIKIQKEKMNLILHINDTKEKLNYISKRFISSTNNLLVYPLPHKNNKYFIVPIVSFNILKILKYVEKSYYIKKHYFHLKDFYENISFHFKLQLSQNSNLNILLESKEYGLEILQLENLRQKLQNEYIKTYVTVNNTYRILLSLKKQIDHLKNYQCYLQQRENKLKMEPTIETFFTTIKIQRKQWYLKKKILKIQLEQSKYSINLMANLFPLNYIQYIYFYGIN